MKILVVSIVSLFVLLGFLDVKETKIDQDLCLPHAAIKETEYCDRATLKL